MRKRCVLLAEFGKLKCVHCKRDTYSGFQCGTELTSEKAESIIIHLLVVMTIMEIPVQIKAEYATANVSSKMKHVSAYVNIKHIICIPHSPT